MTLTRSGIRPSFDAVKAQRLPYKRRAYKRLIYAEPFGGLWTHGHEVTEALDSEVSIA